MQYDNEILIDFEGRAWVIPFGLKVENVNLRVSFLLVMAIFRNLVVFPVLDLKNFFAF
jgi:hypothetical protein